VFLPILERQNQACMVLVLRYLCRQESVLLELMERVLHILIKGKSTMIKLLTGELIPQEGTVWKHPNIRVGYVAQHAFHHLEQHLEKTPNQYIQWRYQGGQDREVLEKASRKLTDEDIIQMEKTVLWEGVANKIELLLGRQKLKKSFQYEVKWVGKIHKHNKWLPREKLLELGFQKMVQAFDDREASREGQGYRELIPSVIREHIEQVGLPGDIADHNQMSGLSGGQKVKVVLAAAMWNNPHMLVLY
jgi:elongation factor 3